MPDDSSEKHGDGWRGIPQRLDRALQEGTPGRWHRERGPHASAPRTPQSQDPPMGHVFPTCFIFASSRRVCSSFRRSFLFPTRMMGTLGQKCFTSGVHFSGMFSAGGSTHPLSQGALGCAAARSQPKMCPPHAPQPRAFPASSQSIHKARGAVGRPDTPKHPNAMARSSGWRQGLSQQHPALQNPMFPLFPWALPRLSGLSIEKHMRITSVSGYERGRSLS